MAETRSQGGFGEYKDTATNFAREGADAVSDAKAKVAETIHDVANTVRQTASQVTGGRSVSSLANEAVERMGNAADYVKDTDSGQMWRDLSGLVKSRPVESLAVAALLGFCMGRARRV